MIKKIMLLLFVSMGFLPCAFAEKTEKDIVLLKEWEEGTFFDETSAPTPWLFDIENRLYKVDPDTPIVRIYNSSLTKHETLSANFAFLGADIYWSGNGGLFYYRSGVYYILKAGNMTFLNKIEEPEIAHGHGLFGNLLIVEDNNKKLRGYLLSDSHREPEKKMSDSEVRIYIKENSAKLDGLTLDTEGVPLFKGVPWSRSGFNKYWGTNIGYFLSIDKDLNTCYSREIRDKTGKVIETFNLSPGAMNFLTLDFEGNVYVMRGFRTYYIGRDWGYSNPRKGVLNESQVRLRLHPGTTELILGAADKGVQVTVFEETAKKETIGGKTAPWYKVKLSSGLVGWMFGAFIDIQK